MKLRRIISLLLVLVLFVSVAGTVSFAEEIKEYQPIDSFEVSTDDVQVPYYMGAAQPGEPGTPYYFLKGGGSTAVQDGYLKTSLPTTSKKFEATPVYIEKVEEGYRMYYMAGENKSYIAIASVGATNNQKNQTDAKNTFTWDEENQVFYQMDTVYGEKEPVKYVLAIYCESDGTPLNRITAERWDNFTEPEPTGARMFPVKLYTPEAIGLRKHVEVDPTPITDPKENTPYFFAINQEDKGENGTMYYWVGRVVDTAAARYLETTTDNGRATIVYLEKVSEGWRIAQMMEGKKEYLYVYRKGSEMALGQIDEQKYATVFRWNAEHNTFVTTYFGMEIYMGFSTDMNDDGTVKTAYTKIRPMNIDSLGEAHHYTTRLIAVPDGIETEAPPPPEPETTEVETDGELAEKAFSLWYYNGVSVVGIVAAVLLIGGGAALVIVDNKSKKK